MQRFFCPTLRTAPAKMRGAHLHSTSKQRGVQGMFAWSPGLQITSILYGEVEYNDRNLTPKDLPDPISPGANSVWFQVTNEHLLVVPNDPCEIKLATGLEIVVLCGPKNRQHYIIALDFGSGCHLRLRRTDDGTIVVAEQTPAINPEIELDSLATLQQYWSTELAGTFRTGPV